MFQFNSNKLIKLCRKLIGMIEDNQIAEELTDKISGIEKKYLSAYEFKNKYKIRVKEIVDLWNCKSSNLETVTMLENSQYDCITSETRYSVRVVNRFNYVEKRATRYEEFFNIEELYEWVFEIITDQGMSILFSKNSNTPSQKYMYHGEESFNVTHS